MRDATRIARYGGVTELKSQTPHAVGQLFFYALGPTPNRATFRRS
ncbi:MAG: hypothetical protein QM736_05830 [Vicinamibacterales bacterium]